MNMAQLSVQNIRAGFAGLLALDDVSISVEKGERVGLIGTNGAGKSTLFSVIGGYRSCAARCGGTSKPVSPSIGAGTSAAGGRYCPRSPPARGQ